MSKVFNLAVRDVIYTATDRWVHALDPNIVRFGETVRLLVDMDAGISGSARKLAAQVKCHPDLLDRAEEFVDAWRRLMGQTENIAWEIHERGGFTYEKKEEEGE